MNKKILCLNISAVRKCLQPITNREENKDSFSKPEKINLPKISQFRKVGVCKNPSIILMKILMGFFSVGLIRVTKSFFRPVLKLLGTLGTTTFSFYLAIVIAWCIQSASILMRFKLKRDYFVSSYISLFVD